MPVDVDIISARLARLEECLKRLREVAGEPLDKFVVNLDLQDKAERNFQIAAQCCIDIGSHILAGQALGVPESYAEIFSLLGKSKIISTDLAEKFVRISGFRNLLVHDYLKLKPERIYASLGELQDFNDFSADVIKYLED